GPCDIYAAANTPCVAAHSTVRALYGAYNGALYQLRRASDKTTKALPVLAPGGFADISVQNTFCTGTTCTISIVYDQSSQHNDLAKSPVAHWLAKGGNEANAADGQIKVSGHTVHGIYVTGYSSNVAYRNNATKGVAKNDQAEAMYMVVDAKRYSDQCCFDYGNAETSGNDDGNGTMEAVYFGNDITWGGKGSGNGPWVAGDLENGVFKSDKGGWQSQSLSVPSAKSIIAAYATAMLKGPSGNHFTLKAGDAQSGALTTMWDGVRPSPGYSPKKLQGAIILGTGGDGSNGGTGTFFEGAMTIGNPPDSVDDAIQANIVAAGYGR
ncbi:MAG TPA: arabinofuranosidase catalytic domain-containing protein, partial [Polyangiaceae bacterium]